MSLEMDARLLREVLQHGEQTYPHECCGLLLGSMLAEGGRRVAAVRRMRNANTASPRNRFDFDPREHLAAQREAREQGLEIVGFYHSHPDHPARPSQTDLEHAAWPGYSYLIVSIVAGAAAASGTANSFELAEDRSRFLPEPLETSTPN
ncbi:MAG TPA: M67 family metallopeptidase [Terriglobales bacterium]|nr:M67 family metallopeptidase [Terriglobales bacterium]